VRIQNALAGVPSVGIEPGMPRFNISDLGFLTRSTLCKTTNTSKRIIHILELNTSL